MRGILLSAAVLAAACSPKPRRAFSVGLLGPVPPRVAAEARRLGLETAETPPPGATGVSAASSGQAVLDFAGLRLLAARVAASGANGVYFRLPAVPAGRDILDFPEEWQAVARVARELLLMRPVLQGGDPAPPPIAVPAGMESNAWTFEGRVYTLIVNPTGEPLRIADEGLIGRRALFEVRADPRQDLAACGGGRCLPPGGVLWLEGRPWASDSP